MFHDYCITEVCISFFFVLTSGRPLPVTTFFVFSKPLAAQIVIREFSAPLQQRCLSLSKGFPLQRETAKICYCCSQPFYSSFVAFLEVILQRCSSAARFIREYTAVSFCKISLKVLLLRLLVRYCLQLFVMRDYFYRLQSHHRISTVVQLTNRLLRFWADRGFVYYKRSSQQSIFSRLVSIPI